MAAPVPKWVGVGQLKDKRENIYEPKDHQETTREQRGNHTGRKGRVDGPDLRFTWDDREPARLVDMAYIIGDFTDILPGIVLSHIGEGEDLHV